MDIASLIGMLVGITCIGLIGYHTSHGHWSMFFSMEGVLAVFGGSISVVFMSMPLNRVLAVPKYIRRFMFHKGKSAVETIQLIGAMSEKARRDGILTLESELKTIKDPFLASAIRLAVDGQDPDVIESTLRLEILAMQERHKSGKKFFDLIKLYGPGWGLVATLIGQIGMFSNMGGSAEDMGKMLALAVTATMYGTVMANAVAGPIGDKLGARSSEEILQREMILQGILSIQAGENPRITVDRLAAFVPHGDRAKVKVAA